MNINPEAKRILCYGDSNTWGYVSGSKHQRLAADIRWPGVLQVKLGKDYEVVEEGLNSRTINDADLRPGKEGRSGTDYILPCLDTVDPVDWVIVMLGTNELKTKYNLNAEQVNERMKMFMTLVQNRKSQCRNIQPKLLLISPPLVNDQTEYCKADNKFVNSKEKSRQLGNLYKHTADELKIEYLNAANLTETGTDGIHITPDSHKKLALAVALIINK